MVPPVLTNARRSAAALLRSQAVTAEAPIDWSTRQCPSCGVVVELPPERLSHVCSYCRSSLVEASADADSPVDRIAPFRLSAKAAHERLRQHLAGRWWAPQSLRRAARDGTADTRMVEGVLVPFYSYSATCRSRYETTVGLYWYETVEKKDRKTGKRRTTQKRHTEWFPLRGTAVAQLRDHLVSASAGLEAAEVAGLQPFDLGRARPFDRRLCAGWPAELPTRTRRHTDADALAQIRADEIARIGAEHLPGDTHRKTRVSCQVELAEAQLVLLPVWVAALRFGDTTYRLMVNGQTGNCHGRAPVSPTKVAIAIAVGVVIAIALVWWWAR